MTEEILQAIFCPLFENQDHVIDVDEKNCRRIRVSLKLAQGILKNSFISNSNSLCFDILKVIDAEKSLKFLLENCKQEKTLGMYLKIRKKNYEKN